MCECFEYLYACVPCTCLAHKEVRRKCQGPWNWLYRWLFSAREANSLLLLRRLSICQIIAFLLEWKKQEWVNESSFWRAMKLQSLNTLRVCGNAEIYPSICVNVQRLYHSKPGNPSRLQTCVKRDNSNFQCSFTERNIFHSFALLPFVTRHNLPFLKPIHT